MNSSVAALPRTPLPVDKKAARVAFYRGEHFTPVARVSPHRTHTWRYPPVVIGKRPVDERDWTGHRVGTMTALYWYRPGRGQNPAVWIARCVCGNYECRVPARWLQFIDQRWHGRDCCETCKDRAVATGKAKEQNTKASRRGHWIASMLDLGLSMEEVVAVMDAKFSTHGLTATDIRAKIASRLDGGQL